MKKLLLILVLLGFLFQGNAQRFDYENTSKVFFGINVGRTWHTSDVENVTKRFPLGAGFVLGGSFNQDYGKAISFDLRLRYLGGNWFGQDTDTTHAIQNNHAVSTFYDSLGYTVQNFKATQHRLALELSIHANRFKERTGFDPYIFAGIGITGTSTKGDLLKKQNSFTNGVIYPYNESPNGNIIDKDYAIGLDKNEAGEAYQKERLETNVMPSLGIGIGYYFNSRISLGIEHKSTFFLGDYFDGTTVNKNGMPSAKIENDIYHYTGVYLKWYFRNTTKERETPKKDAYIPPTQPKEPIVDRTPPANETGRKTPPIVTFSNPASSPFRTSSPVFTLRANIQHVSSASNLKFSRNGEDYTTFIYNPMTRVFESNVNLNIGENVFVLTGNNADGSDTDRVVIIYERTTDNKPNPPTVTIVAPAIRPHTVNQLNYIVKADIQNISSRNQLAVTFNEKTFTDFSYSPSGGINFNANLNLIPGVNTFKIVATNKGGMDLDETVIIYTREATDQTGYPPVVKITTPKTSPYTTNQSSETVVAKVDYVNSKQQIDVKINGVSTTNFNFDLSTKHVQFSADLSIGTNTIIVAARNPYGNNQDKAQIIYQRAQVENGNPPKVKVLTPNINPYLTAQPIVNIIAEVQNVESKNQIDVEVNGVSTTQFTYNHSTKLIQFDVNLPIGNSLVIIRASNAHGNHADNVGITYRKQEDPPSVTILTPNTNPFTTGQTPITVIAEVKNVESKSQITVKTNGVPTHDFTYNNATNRVQLSTDITEGNNVVSIHATSLFGNDVDDVMIIYKREGSNSGSTGNPPKVRITTPNTNPFTNTLASIGVVAEVEHVTSNSQIEVKVNGVSTTNFTFNPSTKQVQFNASLSTGSNIVSVKASNAYGSDSDETQIIYKREVTPEGNPPVVSFITPNIEYQVVEFPHYNMIAKVEHVTKKSSVDLYFNGNLINPNEYTYKPGLQTIHFTGDLLIGQNTYLVIGRNDFGTHNATISIERKRSTIEVIDAEAVSDKKNGTVLQPCNKPTISISSPDATTITTTNSSFDVQGVFGNISSAHEIKPFVNGKGNNEFSFNEVTKSFTHTFELINGENIYSITLTNKCGTVQQEFTIKYEAPAVCGVQVDLGGDETDFCLFTSVGTITRGDLMTNPNFEYNGLAKLLYFKAKENGLAVVNGVDYPILKGNYYYFAGELTIDIGRNKPGNVAQWVVCVESMRQPVSGVGKTKPVSPCEASKTTTEPTTTEPTAPVIKDAPEKQEKPVIRTKPDEKREAPNTRETPVEPSDPKRKGGGNIRSPGGR